MIDRSASIKQSAVISASSLPMSIIIVGVGQEDFKVILMVTMRLVLMKIMMIKMMITMTIP